MEQDAIHRFLLDEATGQFSPDTVYAFMDPHLPRNGSIKGLDAGCGYGGACFRHVAVHGGEWTGVTVSSEQWQYAKKLTAHRGLQASLQFHLLSYDEPLPGRYSVAIAIESLIHSADPALTLANLASALDEGGRLILVDDMPSEDIAKEDKSLLDEFKRCWRAPCAPTATDWRRHAAAAGLRPLAMEDLSSLMRPRAEAELDAALADLGGQRAAKAASGFARLSDAEIGGLHLERLHRRGSMKYMMLVFER